MSHKCAVFPAMLSFLASSTVWRHFMRVLRFSQQLVFCRSSLVHPSMKSLRKVVRMRVCACSFQSSSRAHSRDINFIQSIVRFNAGLTLVFVTYPDAIVRMPGSTFWSASFFLMLILLGIGTQVTKMQQQQASKLLRNFKSSRFFYDCSWVLWKLSSWLWWIVSPNFVRHPSIGQGRSSPFVVSCSPAVSPWLQTQVPDCISSAVQL